MIEGILAKDDTKEITITEMDCMLEDLAAQKKTYEDAKKASSKEFEKLENLKREVLYWLEKSNHEKYSSRDVTVYKQARHSYKVPKGDQQDMFYAWLKERGDFDRLISVHSRTLNAYCKEEMEAALSKGDVDFEIPGVEYKLDTTLAIKVTRG